MKVTSAEFVVSAASAAGCPPAELPEVAFIGRSNVGKSSLINSLLARKRLAQTSATPGKTRLINFFIVNGLFNFVDLPGYGYARVSKSVLATWEKMIEGYLRGRRTLRGVVLLVDLRHPPGELDRGMKGWLDHFGCPTVVAATKADKIGMAERSRNTERIRRELPVAEGEPLVVYSARTGMGKDRLWQALRELMDQPAD